MLRHDQGMYFAYYCLLSYLSFINATILLRNSSVLCFSFKPNGTATLKLIDHKYITSAMLHNKLYQTVFYS